MHVVLLYCALSTILGGDVADLKDGPSTGPTEVIISDLHVDVPNKVDSATTNLPQGPGLSPTRIPAPVAVPFTTIPAPITTPITAPKAPIAAPVAVPSLPRIPVRIPLPVVQRNRRNVILICPPALLSGMAKWIDYRQGQGYKVVQVDGRLDSVELLQAIRKYARREPLSAIVIVGDADLTMDSDPELRQYCVPSVFANATVISKLGSESHIASDSPYADLDGDQVPDVPIGRLCVDSPEQLAIVVDKIIDYEQLPPTGHWRHTVHLAAGIGDFGVVADTVIETVAKKFLADGIPPAYRTTMTYGNWRSPYCPDPRAFREVMLDRVEEGCLFWVYMGHGRPHRLDRFQVGDSISPILEAGDIVRFRSSAGMPIAVLLACYTGAYDQPRDCLAERMLQTPGGPVAVLAASRLTLPYSMSILGTGMMEKFFAQQQTTLGEIVLTGKRNLASNEGGKNRRLIDSVARTISPTKEELPAERREHQYTFNLFGDPLLVIRQPRMMEMSNPEQVAQGDLLRVSGYASIGGECTVELVCRRDRTTFSPPRRKLPTDAPLAMAMTETYYRANDSRWYQRQFRIRPGKFTVEIKVPPTAKGPSHVRLAIANQADLEIGATDVYIRQATSQKDLRTSNAER